MCSATVDHPEAGPATVVWATLGEHVCMKPLLAGDKQAALTEVTHKGKSWTGFVNSKRNRYEVCTFLSQCKSVVLFLQLQFVCVHVFMYIG